MEPDLLVFKIASSFAKFLFWSFKVVKIHLIIVSGIQSIFSHKKLHTLFDCLVTMLRDCRYPKCSSMDYIFFYFDNSVYIRDI